MTMAQKKSNKVLCKGSCEREITINSSNFYKTGRKDCVKYNGFYPICKNCMSKIMLDANGRVTEERFKTVCKHLDIVFIPTIYKEALERNGLEKNQMKVLADYRALLTMNSNYRDLTFTDSVKFDYLNMNQDDNTINEEYANDKNEVSKEIIEFWGEGFEPSVYEKYQEEYENLCTIYNDGNEAKGTKLTYYKNLAMLSYKAQKQLLDGDMKSYNASMATYATICEKCGINPKQVQDKDDSNKGTFGVFIKMIEDEEPIFDPEEHLGKVDVVRRCLEVFFFGHLAEVNGWRNPLKCKYDETMQEYSVKVDTYEDLMNIEENDEEINKGLKRVLKVKGLFKNKRPKTLKEQMSDTKVGD